MVSLSALDLIQRQAQLTAGPAHLRLLLGLGNKFSLKVTA